MECAEILAKLRTIGNPKNVAGMARYGINPRNALGVPLPSLRTMARQLSNNHSLALQLWSSGIHEAQILAALIDDPASVTERQMESWVRDLDSWDTCDQCCNNLFRETQFAHRKAIEWTARKEEFVRRAGFVLMACLAVHDKDSSDARFARYLAIIKKGATDERNFVKKANNWALRQIGKRNLNLQKKAIQAAKEIYGLESKSARWIASDALRELTDPKTSALVRGRQTAARSSRKK